MPEDSGWLPRPQTLPLTETDSPLPGRAKPERVNAGIGIGCLP